MMVETVPVRLGTRSYDIHIGPSLLENAGALLKPLLARPRIAIVTDENVFAAQADRLKGGLKKGGVAFDFITLAPGEGTKSFAQLETLTGRLLDLGIERGDMVVAFGGGVVGDITGFAAAILRRGCGFAQIPTSLLAQVDSAVGGKTAINAPQGKNLIGAFHQPTIVLADTTSLDTLPQRELRAGYAEIVKYGLISDPEFFDWLEKNAIQLLSSKGASMRQYAVKKSCEAKAALVSADEREEGARALLNLGHTFGHAFEAAYGYNGALLHGEAIGLGMTLAFEYSAHLGLCSAAEAARVKAHIAASGLPASITDLPDNDQISADNLTALMLQDKKVQDGKLTLILANEIGGARIVQNASVDDVRLFLKEKIAR